VFEHPQHPYTIGLMGSIPRVDIVQEWLPTIPGSLPIASDPLPGCRFAPRCPFADGACNEIPVLTEMRPDHSAACWKAPL
jgi:oligopeptide/dipeptide ABC transporter ATP-binding protein